jgi:hypothetical protein
MTESQNNNNNIETSSLQDPNNNILNKSNTRDVDVISNINWNEVIKKEARGIDGEFLGEIRGVTEPYLLVESGVISKEKFYIPKNLIERYDDIAVYFGITEEEKKKLFKESLADFENRTNKDFKKELLAERERNRIEAEEKAERQRNQVQRIENNIDDVEKEITKKLKQAAHEFKETIVTGSKVAESKIKEAREAAEEKKVKEDSQKISKMGSLATQFTTSFDDIVDEIRTRTYAEQEQIYTGFLKIIDNQRDLISARKELAIKLKDAVKRPVFKKDESQENKS